MHYNDGWTLVENNGGFVAQHEHIILVTDGEPKFLQQATEFGISRFSVFSFNVQLDLTFTL